MESTTVPMTDSVVADRIAQVESGIPRGRSLRHETPGTQTLADAMAQFDVPGISVAVINEGKIEWAKGYGVTESGKPDPVTTRTLFQAGSISKPVAAMAALRLVQEGKLGLDEDVNRYLTSWKVPANGDWQPRVTLRQLLSHTAGMTVHGFPGYASWRDIPTTVQVLNGEPPTNTAPIRVNMVPGTQFRYSGGGTTIVQLVLMDVLGKPFPEIARELVLGPLEMNDSTYEQPLPPDRAAIAATAHSNDSHPLEGKWHVYPEMAAAGLWTTASDLARFAIEVQRSLQGKSNRVLSADLITQMLTPQVEDHIGIGFFLEGKDDTARFGHGGVDEGFVASLKAYKNRGQGLAIMCNGSYGWSVMPDFERAVASVYEWPDILPTFPEAVMVESATLSDYAGTYELRPNFSFRVTTESGSLQIAPTGQSPLPLFATAENAFFSRVLDSEFRFERSESGAVEKLILVQNGRELSAKRTG